MINVYVCRVLSVAWFVFGIFVITGGRPESWVAGMLCFVMSELAKSRADALLFFERNQ